MLAQRKRNLISETDYLIRESRATIKHEYVDGVVYAMAGARNVHNAIASNILGALHYRLRGRTCRPYNSDTKIRIKGRGRIRFYYPDVSVVCESNRPTETFQDRPVALFEVVSTRTRRTDEGEKKEAYLDIPSLALYAIVEQEAPAVVAFHRTGGEFSREILEGLDAVLSLPDLKLDLPLVEIFEGIQFSPEPLHEDNV